MFKSKMKFFFILIILFFVFSIIYLSKNYNLEFFLNSFCYSSKTLFLSKNEFFKKNGKLNVFGEYFKTLYNIKNLDKKDKDIILLNYKIFYDDSNLIHLLFREIFIDLTYYFESFVKAPLIIDCGANIGMSSLFFKKIYPDSRIICFEPSNKNFKFLEKNIKENKLKNVTLINKALFNKKSFLNLYNTGTAVSSLINYDNLCNNVERVETVLLSEYIKESVDFLKMDIEGAEIYVLEDLDKNKKLQMIKQAVIEYHVNIKNNFLTKLLQILDNNGFNYVLSSDKKVPLRAVNEYSGLIYAYQK